MENFAYHRPAKVADAVKIMKKAKDGKITATETFVSKPGESAELRKENQAENVGWYAGITADMFQRRTSIVRLDEKSLRRSVETISQFSALEGLDAHGRSATIRLE